MTAVPRFVVRGAGRVFEGGTTGDIRELPYERSRGA